MTPVPNMRSLGLLVCVYQDLAHRFAAASGSARSARVYRRAARSPRPAIRDPRPAQCPLSSALLCACGRCWAGGQATPSVRSPWLIRDRMRPRAQALLRDRTCSRSDPTSSTRASSAVRGSRGLTADQSRCRRALAIDPRRHTDVRGSCRSPDHALRVMITVTIADTHVGV